MTWARMLWVAIRLAWPYVLTPWRSPLLRWRMETYGVRGASGRMLAAGEIGFGEFWAFVFANGGRLRSFLRWAATL